MDPRILVRKPMQDDIHYCEFSGSSTVDKPTGVAGGSLFFETDTGDVYIYDEPSADWTLWIEGGGS